MNNALNVFIIFWSKIIIALVAFATEIIIARQFGPGGKGVYDLFLTITSLIVIVGGLGIGTSLIYLINKEKRDSAKLVSNSLIFGIIWGTILSALFYLVFLYFPQLLSGLPSKYIFLAFLVITSTLLHNCLLPFFLARLQIVKWALFLIFDNALILVGVISLVFVFNSGIDSIIYAVALSNVLTFFLIVMFIFRAVPFRFSFDKNLFGEEIKVGLKSYLADIFNLVNFKLSLVFVSILAGIVATGYYSVTINIISILFFIPSSLQQVLYSAWSLSSDDKEIDKDTIKIARQSLIIGIISSLFLFLVGKYLIVFFYGKEFYPAFSFLLGILPGFIFMSFASIFFNNFFAKGKQHITTIVLIIVLMINIFLNLILISNPKIGVLGAPIAISISYFIAAVLSVSIFSKNSGYSVWEIIRIRSTDFKDLYLNLKSIF